MELPMRATLIARLAVALGLCALLTPLSAWAEPHFIYLTRHAEKAEGAKDPDLTAQGQARARSIAAILRRAGVRAIFSTHTKRTEQTAAPLATQLGLDVQLYDAAKPALLIEKIKAGAGPTLVIGHSNTVPELVRLLGGVAGADIGDNEYERLYQIAIGDDGKVTTVLLNSVATP